MGRIRTRCWWSPGGGDECDVLQRVQGGRGDVGEELRGFIYNPSFADTNTEVGVRYYYFIFAANGYGKSEQSSYDVGWRNGIPRVPRWAQASDGAYTDRVQVSWEAVPAATYYNVYRAGGADVG